MPNAQTLARAKMNTVLEMVRLKRLRWLGHVARQADSSLPKRLMHSRLPSKASKGRPTRCRTDYIREDSKKMVAQLGTPSSRQRFMDRQNLRTPSTLSTMRCVID